MLGTLERTNQILRLFTLDSPEWGISELASELGWSTSTTHDLVSSLAQIGLLMRSNKRRYTVGWRVLELSHVVLGSNKLQAAARYGMEQFASKYDETILLGVLAGGKVLFADKIVSSSGLPDAFTTGDGRFFAHATAAGKVLLANLDANERQQLIAEHPLVAVTPKSIQSQAVLDEALLRVQAQGHAYAFEEAIAGFGCVAAPVLDYTGQVVASLSTVAGIRQFERNLDSYRDAIVRAAGQVSRRLGYFERL